MASDAVGHIGTLLNIYNFLKELVDHKTSMKEEHSSEGIYLTIRFTAGCKSFLTFYSTGFNQAMVGGNIIIC